MAKSDQLGDYKRKRSFEKSPEPSGAGEAQGSDKPRFVIQKHAARSLHYDFRLEFDGVLKSFAVPKGPSTNPSDKRMATPTEDHPLDYADFEGIIPRGEYGAGTVLVWDAGSYTNLTEKNGSQVPLDQALANGHAVISLQGRKLSGGYALTRIATGTKNERWLLVKTSDRHADPDHDLLDTEPDSVLSGRSMEEVTQGVAVTDVQDRLTDAERQNVRIAESPPPGAKPMLATLSKRAFSDPRWIFEPKLDGVRCLCYRDGADTQLMSRNRKSLNATYPELVEALGRQPATRFLADGEIVAFDGELTSFSRLQQRMQLQDPDAARGSKVAVFIYLFDLLWLDGYDITALSLRRRKELLEASLSFQSPVFYSSHMDERGEELFKQACKHKWEGLIAKRADSGYSFKRSRDWLKLKCSNEQELVVAGYTAPRGSRKHLGALVLGFYRGNDLIYAGKVGTGFDDKTLEHLHKRLSRLGQKTSPFTDQNSLRVRDVHWVKPELVAQVDFTEWTQDGRLRHPRFLGLREDKRASQVVKES
jgi:bifunctional non-homologous end joining protein LigD